MKNKIGILENDIYIFPIVNSLILLVVHSFDNGLEGIALRTIRFIYFAYHRPIIYFS